MNRRAFLAALLAPVVAPLAPRRPSPAEQIARFLATIGPDCVWLAS